MMKYLGLLLVACVCGQNVVNRVFVLNHRDYMVSVIGETVKLVEERKWCNLHLPDMTREIDEEIFSKNYTGTVTYKNGFVVSIQHISVLQSSLNQIWTRVAEDNTVRVEIRGQLRIEDISIGFDIEADLQDGVHHYTGLYNHPLLQFDFSIFRNADTHAMDVTVAGTQPVSRNLISILPRDATADALTTLFDPASTADGVRAWAPEVFQPIAMDVILNRVEFPGLCYNCPLQ